MYSSRLCARVCAEWGWRAGDRKRERGRVLPVSSPGETMFLRSARTGRKEGRARRDETGQGCEHLPFSSADGLR
ncbi:uncharacterized protein BKA78DRAFT_315665 [Phyllosticta capitalensis]|uniref:uncharacterized protein n=1 Tax=Phyllosticta capitalensis TaxID=121624 RepID=UPI003130BE86